MIALILPPSLVDQRVGYSKSFLRRRLHLEPCDPLHNRRGKIVDAFADMAVVQWDDARQLPNGDYETGLIEGRFLERLPEPELVPDE